MQKSPGCPGNDGPSKTACSLTAPDSKAPHQAPPCFEHWFRCSIPLDKLRELMQHPLDIVIEGETGSGKDTLAKTLHGYAGRPGAFVALNCAALPESLAEAELFGVEMGAYTGAMRTRQGRIEAAHRGTLYLDEIDSMSLTLQAKLLRVLQERGVEHLGSTRFIPLDFRLLTSTKVPLKTLVETDRFRLDLYHRLNVICVQVRPLRERVSEIVSIFREACATYGRQIRQPVPEISPTTELLLQTHNWPGNLRELYAAACRHMLGLPIIDTPAGDLVLPCGLRERLYWFERTQIMRTMADQGGSIKLTSQKLKIPLKTLYYRMRLLNIPKAVACDIDE